MKVGYLQYDVTHNAQKNINCIKRYLEQNKCDVIVLPELSLCGYLFKNRQTLISQAENVPCGPLTQTMIALSKEYCCTIIFGLAENEGDKIYNTAVIVSKGFYVGKYRKILYPTRRKSCFTEERITLFLFGKHKNRCANMF